MPPDTTPIPVTVVAGVARRARHRLLRELMAARPDAARWAILDNDDAGPLQVDEADGAGRGVHRFAVAGGCACCIAGPVFRATLARLLRAGPWERLLVNVHPSGHAHAIVDQLRSPPFDRILRVSRLLVPVTAAASRPARSDDESGLGDAALGFASDFVLPDDADDAMLAAAAAVLERAGPWPRRRTADEDGRWSPADRRATRADEAFWQTGAAVGEPAAATPGALGPAWQVFSAVPATSLARAGLLVRRWDGEAVAQRRPMLDLLGSLARESDVAGFLALVGTPRAWYRWAWGRIDAAEPLVVDQADLTEDETTWRLDSRLVVSLAAGADRDRAAALLEPLAGLFDRP